MKYINTFNKSLQDDIMSEIYVVHDIENFFKKHDLDDIVVKIGNKTMHILYGYFHDSDTEKYIYKLIDGEKEDIMVGIPRYRGLETYTKILKYLQNLTPEEIELEKARINANKYNI